VTVIRGQNEEWILLNDRNAEVTGSLDVCMEEKYLKNFTPVVLGYAMATPDHNGNDGGNEGAESNGKKNENGKYGDSDSSKNGNRKNEKWTGGNSVDGKKR
jgi:hypothetical protein